MAKYRNLSWFAFYPPLNIFGKQMNDEAYIDKPIDMQGKITKKYGTFRNIPKINPAIRPAFIKIVNFSNNYYSTSIHASKNPIKQYDKYYYHSKSWLPD